MAKKIKATLRILLVLIVLGSNIGCDQVSKNIARTELGYNEQITFVNQHVTLLKVENTGAFLSLGQTLPKSVKYVALMGLPSLALVFALVFMFIKKNTTTWSLVGMAFVAGGGIGNIYDRIVYGSVTDFMHIDFVIFQTGIFNMADVSIMVGLFIILIDNFSKKRLNPPTEMPQ